MKKILLPTIAALLLSGCATYTPSFKAFLAPQEVTVNAVKFGSGHVILIANGTDKTLTSVAARLEGVAPDQVIGAWNCVPSVAVPDSSICTVSTTIQPNDGLSLFTSKKITGGEVGYKIGDVIQRTEVKLR